MAPLVLEGETLGQKQHSLNKLVEAAVADESSALPPLDYDAADVDNLVRIDVACRRRDVGYVLAALQSEDMLYVSRAIKRATWLITDDQYAHIINPKHLHDELFPKMTSKAKNKLLSAIRLNLENEARVDEFFYYFEDDLEVAQKWLPRCSLPLIEKVYRQNESNSPSNRMTVKTVKRLCERSLSVLQILIEVKGIYYIGREKFTNSKILLSKNAEEYLNTLESLDDHSMPDFGIRATRQLMKHCPDKVVNKFEQFFKNIHLPTFAKYLKQEDIQGFLLKQADNKHWKMEGWFKYENVKHFVKRLPIESRFEFIKQLLIDKDKAFDNRWYQFAPFDTALTDLKKLIRLESSPAERTTMLTTLINCAGRNPLQVQLVLQYYRDKHINEPFKFKVQFVNCVLSSVATHKLDENTWNILNDIFSSMEVYIESENKTPRCIKAIIVYKLLRKEDIPEIIQKKHTFDTFKDYYKKLEKTERDLVFKYLYILEMDKLQKQNLITNPSEISSAIDKLLNILLLLKEWEMKLSDYPEVLNQISHIIKIKKKHSIKVNLMPMYERIVNKSWRKDLFEDSLTLQNNDSTCVHSLKHDPGLLLRHSTEVAAMMSNEEISLQNTLRKIRIYWTESLAQKWTDQYILALEKPTGHKATVEGICILLPRKQFMSLLEKYAPNNTKIDWNNSDTATLSVQKSLAKRMKLVRPSLQLEAILPYAKNDYLQFALPSLNSLLYNMSATQVSKYIPTLFNSPVSLKKHGVRLAYSKLRFSEIKDLVENTWRNTKKSSIRTILFKETFELLTNQKKDTVLMDLWELMSIFIENLTPNENLTVYRTLNRVQQVPLLVRPQFLMKAFTFLKSLPKKSQSIHDILSGLEREACRIIEQLEPTFVEQVLLKSVDELVNIMTGNVGIDNNCNTELVDAEFQKEILIAYIANSNNEESQYAKYEKYLVPILDGCFQSWKIFKNGERIAKSNCVKLLDEALFTPVFLRSSVLNIRIFKDFETIYRTALPLEENYRYVISWTVSILFVESLHNYINKSVGEAKDLCPKDFMRECPPDRISKPNKDNWEDLCTAIAPLFGKACLNFIKQDCTSKLLTLNELFANSLNYLFWRMKFKPVQELQVLKNMLDSEETVSYLVVLRSICSRFHVHAQNEESKELILEIFNIIKLYPSPDVKIQFYEFVLRKQPQYFRDIVT